MSDQSGRTPPPADPESFFALFRKLADESALLVRQELDLARAEIRRNIAEMVRHVGQIATGGVVAFVGVLVLVAFLIVGLGALLGGLYWLSTLLVALLLLGSGVGIAFLGARKLTEESLVPENTLESISVTGRWLGGEIRGLKDAVTEAGPQGTRPGSAIPLRPAPGSARPFAGDGVRAEPALAAVHGSSLDGVSPPDVIADRERERAGQPGAAPGGAARPGGSARLPLSVPLHRRVLHEFQDDDIPGQGAKVAFFMFTSLPPALLVLFGLVGVFGGDRLAGFLTAQIQQALPGSAGDPDSAAGFLSQFIDQVVYQSAPGPLSIGLLLGIWAGSAVFVALTETLNLAYDVEEGRSWFRRRTLAIAVMIGFLLLFLGGSAILIAGPFIADAIQLGGAADLAWAIAQWPLAFGLVVAAFFLVYHLLPNRDQTGHAGTLLRGSAIAAGLWVLATIGFRIYITNFGSYAETYGFVGAILVLLLWMWITGIVILLGGEISSEMERAN